MEPILVADDIQVRQLVKILLTRQGYHVDEAENGIEALSIIERVQPSLVFLDIGMPGMDGLEVLRKVREKYPTMRVIIMTGMNQEEIWKKAMTSGATDYIMKPFSLDQLDTNLAIHLPMKSEDN